MEKPIIDSKYINKQVQLFMHNVSPRKGLKKKDISAMWCLANPVAFLHKSAEVHTSASTYETAAWSLVS